MLLLNVDIIFFMSTSSIIMAILIPWTYKLFSRAVITRTWVVENTLIPSISLSLLLFKAELQLTNIYTSLEYQRCVGSCATEHPCAANYQLHLEVNQLFSHP